MLPLLILLKTIDETVKSPARVVLPKTVRFLPTVTSLSINTSPVPLARSSRSEFESVVVITLSSILIF